MRIKAEVLFVVVGGYSASVIAEQPALHSAPMLERTSPKTILVQNTTTSLPKDVSELLQYSPAAVEASLILNTPQIKTGALWDTYGSLLEGALKTDPTFVEFVKEANWDPLTETSQVYVSFTDLDQDEPAAVIALRGKKLKNIQDALAKDPGMIQSKYKGAQLFSDADFSISFPSSDIVLFGDTVEVKEALGASGVSKEMTGLLSSSGASAAIFGGLVPNKQLRKEMSDELADSFPEIAQLSGLYFSLNASKGLDLFTGARFSKKEAATKAVLFFSLAISAQEDQWKDAGLWPYFSSMKAEAAQNDLLFSWKLGEQDSLSLVEIFAGPSKPASKKHKSNLGGKR